MAGERGAELGDRYQPAVSTIEELVRDVPGWSPIDELMALYTLALTTVDLPGDIIEIGAWCGRSSVVLGLAATQLGCHVFSTDLFPTREDWHQNADGSYSMQVGLSEGVVHAYQAQTVWREAFDRDIAPLYVSGRNTEQIFRSVVESRGLSHVITANKSSTRWLSTLREQGVRSRLAFIDGDHGYDAVCYDIRQVESLLVPGGWICFDDAFSHYDGVDRAIRDLIVDSGNYTITQQLTRKCFAAKRRVDTL